MQPDFNFIVDIDEEPEILPPIEPIGTLSKIVKMTPRRFAQTVLDVFDRLGGLEWLLAQAIIDPRGYLELLKKILPSNIQAEGLEGITVLLRDTYGNTLEVGVGGGQPVVTGGDHSPRSGQPQIATGGNPTVTKSGAADATVVLKETYE